MPRLKAYDKQAEVLGHLLLHCCSSPILLASPGMMVTNRCGQDQDEVSSVRINTIHTCSQSPASAQAKAASGQVPITFDSHLCATPTVYNAYCM